MGTVEHDAEPLATSIVDDVDAAEEKTLEVARVDPERTWTPRELMAEAKNGFSNSVMSIAFWNLVQQNVLRVSTDMTVRLV